MYAAFFVTCCFEFCFLVLTCSNTEKIIFLSKINLIEILDSKLKTSSVLLRFSATDDFKSADFDSGASSPVIEDQQGLDSAEMSEIAEFIDQCSVDVWLRVRNQLRAEWASNRVRLQAALELSAQRKAAQLSRLLSQI